MIAEILNFRNHFIWPFAIRVMGSLLLCCNKLVSLCAVGSKKD